MKRIALYGLLLATVMSAGCQQACARQFGGTTTVNLPAGRKLVNATWKESNIWYLHRPMRAGEQPEDTTFSESSETGMLQGSVTFKETR
jgi:hypothetical protein